MTAVIIFTELHQPKTLFGLWKGCSRGETYIFHTKLVGLHHIPHQNHTPRFLLPVEQASNTPCRIPSSHELVQTQQHSCSTHIWHKDSKSTETLEIYCILSNSANLTCKAYHLIILQSKRVIENVMRQNSSVIKKLLSRNSVQNRKFQHILKSYQ